jgi:hypothetical protein
MPNYCDNKLTIMGPSGEIALFVKEKLDFNVFVPPPDDAERDWFSEHWGTSNRRDDIDIEQYDSNSAQFKFITAWAPPIPFCRALLKKYPECWIKHEFTIDMMALSGIWIGEITKTGEITEQVLEWEVPWQRFC